MTNDVSATSFKELFNFNICIYKDKHPNFAAIVQYQLSFMTLFNIINNLVADKFNQLILIFKQDTSELDRKISVLEEQIDYLMKEQRNAEKFHSREDLINEYFDMRTKLEEMEKKMGMR